MRAENVGAELARKEELDPGCDGGVDQEFLRFELRRGTGNATYESILVLQSGDKRGRIGEVDCKCFDIGRRGWRIIIGRQAGNGPDLKTAVFQ